MVDMKILGASVAYSEDYKPIDKLKFLKDNPRVYAVTHGEPGFEQKPEPEQQEIIFEKLKEEPSVKNLLPEVRRHGGLIEPILVRLDTNEVIEGNSRLAVYRILRDDPEVDGEWDLIPCHLVSALTDEQQFAFLNQIHVKGRTQWSAYEKANFAYVRRINNWSFEDIAKLFGESASTIRNRFNAIKLMRESDDNDHDHFSYYDVMVRASRSTRTALESKEVRTRLVKEIRNLGSAEAQAFTAQDLRNRLPAIVHKPKVLARYARGEIGFREAAERAEVGPAEEAVRKALTALDEVSKEDVDGLDQNARNSLWQKVKKLDREVARISGLVRSGGVQ